MTLDELKLESERLRADAQIVATYQIAEGTGSEGSKKYAKEMETVLTRMKEVEQEIYDMEHDPAFVERQGLVNGAKVAPFIQATIRGEKLKGREAELSEEVFGRSDARGEEGGLMLPWAALDRKIQAADAASNFTGDGQVNQDAILGRIFSRSVCAYMGCEFQAVPDGTATFLVLTAGNPPAIKAKGAAHDATAATLATTELKPERLTARLLFRREDAARLPGLEMALRNDIIAAMQDELDKQVIQSTSKGFASLTNPTDPTTTFTFKHYTSWLVGELDGLYAYTNDDLRVLIPAGIATDAAAESANSNKGDETAWDYLNERYTIRISNHMPAVASNVGTAYVHKTQSGSTDFVGAVWGGGVELVRDPYSEAASGEISVTGIMMQDWAILREDAFSRLEVKTA